MYYMDLARAIFTGINDATFRLLTEGRAGEELRSVLVALGAVTAKWYPAREDVFRAIRELPIDDTGAPVIKVVVVGQDPYHDGSADGIAFSCRGGVPPSLRNIYKALVKSGFLTAIPTSADLVPLAHQGVLLLNTALTVEESKPKSHSALWDKYTTELFRVIAGHYPDAVFMCWGNDAKDKVRGIGVRNLLTWGHPSPISSFNKSDTNPKSFVNCDNFTRARELVDVNWGVLGRVDVPVDVAANDYVGVDGGSRANGKPECRSAWGVCYIGESGKQVISAGLVDGASHSNNRGELVAMIKGMDQGIAVGGPRPLVIVCDSKYTIGVVESWGARWFAENKTEGKKNLDLVKIAVDTVARLRALRPVTFRHVNSHIVCPSGPPHEVVCWTVNDEADKANQRVLDAPTA